MPRKTEITIFSKCEASRELWCRVSLKKEGNYTANVCIFLDAQSVSISLDVLVVANPCPMFLSVVDGYSCLTSDEDGVDFVKLYLGSVFVQL